VLHRIAISYATWLITPFGRSEKPPILYIFVLCPFSVLAVFGYGLPYWVALCHGTPVDASLPGISKHGVAFSMPMRPWIMAGFWTLLVVLPPLFSAVAFQLGWLGREVRDGDGQNDG
jgi:hypothetical protein